MKKILCRPFRKIQQYYPRMCDSNFLCLVFWISCAVGEVFFRYSVPRRCIVMFANHNFVELCRTCSVFCADQPGRLRKKGVTDTVSSNDASWSEHTDLDVFWNTEFIYFFVLCVGEIEQKTTPCKYLENEYFHRALSLWVSHGGLHTCPFIYSLFGSREQGYCLALTLSEQLN